MAAFAGSIVSTCIVASPLIGSNHNPLDLIEANLIAAMIIELRLLVDARFAMAAAFSKFTCSVRRRGPGPRLK
jgi:hypothetical protein